MLFRSLHDIPATFINPFATCDLNIMKSPVFGVALTPAKDVIVFEKSTLGIDFLPPSIISFKPALYVEDLLKEVMDEDNRNLEPNKNFNPRRVKNKPFMEMSSMEQIEILNKDGRYKTIICRCENITEGEIVNAINRHCGAKTVDGVKRRVRPGMGRCQGGFCGPKVVEILARELNITPEEVLKDYENSNMLVGKLKEVRGETVEI